MKKTDIKVGNWYTDDKGGIREVIAEGPQFVLYSGQRETDNVQYKVIAKTHGPHMVGDICNCTRVSFASWAKRIIA